MVHAHLATWEHTRFALSSSPVSNTNWHQLQYSAVRNTPSRYCKSVRSTHNGKSKSTPSTHALPALSPSTRKQTTPSALRSLFPSLRVPFPWYDTRYTIQIPYVFPSPPSTLNAGRWTLDVEPSLGLRCSIPTPRVTVQGRACPIVSAAFK